MSIVQISPSGLVELVDALAMDGTEQTSKEAIKNTVATVSETFLKFLFVIRKISPFRKRALHLIKLSENSAYEPFG